MNMNNETFFYAEYEAGMYDETIALTTPFYNEAIEVMMKLVAMQCESIFSENILLLDIGAGTGNESIKLMQGHKNIYTIAVDLCSPMSDEYIKKYNREIFTPDNLKRFDYFVDDIFHIKSQKLISILSEKKFQIIISAYTLHHYLKQDKEKLFKRIYDMLEDGGIFINLDLFSFDSPLISSFTDKESFLFIDENFENPGNEFMFAQKIPIDERRRLKNLWVKHYKMDNVLTSIEEQRDFLEQIGFSQTSIPFMYLQNGLIWAKK